MSTGNWKDALIARDDPSAASRTVRLFNVVGGSQFGPETALQELGDVHGIINCSSLKALDMLASSIQPGAPQCPPVFCGSPHEGEFVIAELLLRMDNPLETLAIIDAGARRLRPGNVPSQGSILSRYVVDPNRRPGRADDDRPGKVVNLQRFHDGAYGMPLYQDGKAPGSEEADQLVSTWWIPYWRRVLGLGRGLLQQYPVPAKILALDMHTMPPPGIFCDWLGAYGLTDAVYGRFPLFILGTKDRTTCSSEVLQMFASALTRAFYAMPPRVRDKITKRLGHENIVWTDHYLKGVASVELMRELDPERVHAIQVEVNEAAFRPDGAHGPYDKRILGFLKLLIETAINDITPYLLGEVS